MAPGFWSLSYSSIKNSASSEQKIKTKVHGEVILHSQSDSQGYTEENKVRRGIEVSRINL